MKHSKRNENPKKLPAGAVRTMHPRLGVRVWRIGGKYYRTKADYLYPPLVIDAEKHVSIKDTSLPE